MSKKNFNDFILSNTMFWKSVNKKSDENGYLLYDAFYNESMRIYGITKTALVLANIKGLKPLGLEPLKPNEENYQLIHSMNKNMIGNKNVFLFSSVIQIFPILKVFLSVKTKKDLINLKIDNYEIGKYLYDHILISFKIPTIEYFSFAIRKRLLMEICYFFYFKKVISEYNIKMIVIGDNVYRYGLLFELAKQNNIECVAPISLNTYSTTLFKEPIDFTNHYRRPEQATLNVLENNIVDKYVDDYFEKRFSANLDRHDVKNAFSKDKPILSKDEVVEQYNLNPNLPIVIVMAHVFCDAPHGNPGLLFDDYYDWIVNTITSLNKNKQVNFLVKEHPSAELYNEKGRVSKILSSLQLNHLLIDEKMHNMTILNDFDVVVTCGGTIGLEFCYKSKPVVLGSKPPYSGFGFTHEPTTKEDYNSLMVSGIESLPKLDETQRDNVKKFIYHDFVLMDNYHENLELGGQQFYFGKEIDYDMFYDEVIKYNDNKLEDQNIYQLLNNFVKSGSKKLIKNFKKEQYE